MLCDTQNIPKASENILGSFEKKNFPSNFRTSETIFFLIELTNPLKMAFHEGFQNLKAFSRWKLWPRYNKRSFFGSYCNFLSSGFCLKWFLAEKINFELWYLPRITQIYVKIKENSIKNMVLSEFWAVPDFKIDFFSKKSF